MNKNLLKIINNSYFFLNKTVPILENYKSNSFLHDKIMIDKLGFVNKNTFVGKNNCGACCYLLDYYLKKYNIKTKLFLTKNGYGKYKNDHCFLLYKNKYIIDPTYRQFFNIGIKYDKYKENLFLFNNFIFIGTFKDMENFNKKSNYLYKNLNNSDLDNDILENWINKKEDITYKLDSENLIDKEYALQKGKSFYNLHKFFLN